MTALATKGEMMATKKEPLKEMPSDGKDEEPKTSAQLYSIDAENLSELARLEGEERGAKAA